MKTSMNDGNFGELGVKQSTSERINEENNKYTERKRERETNRSMHGKRNRQIHLFDLICEWNGV